MIPVDTLAGTTQWVIAHGYGLMFVAMCLEGPLMTTAAAFAAALGYFDIGLVFILSVLGDLVPDVVLYVGGYLSRVHAVEHLARRLGVDGEHIRRMERLLSANLWKSLLVAKFAPVVSMVGLMFFGAFKVPFRRYMGICAVISLPKCLFFIIVGYQASWAYAALQSVVAREALWFIAAAGAILLFLGYRKAIQEIVRRWA